MFITAPTEYFTVKSEQEMDLVSVIAMNFMLEVFLIFLQFEQWAGPLEYVSGNAHVDRSN